MAEIVLSEEQTRMVRETAEPITVRGSDGGAVGSLRVMSPDEAELVAQALERRERRKADPRPGVPHEVVHRRLLAVQAEWERLGGFDEEYGRAFWAKLKAGDA